MKIALGSTNPAKLKAVKTAFEKMWPEKKLTFTGVDVDSGVASQPMNDEETMQGAINRASKALAATGADIGVGIEGGIQQINLYWFTGNIAAVVTKDGARGVGISARVALPEKIYKEIQKGSELNSAIEEVYGLKDVGKRGGVLGMISSGHITRASASCDAVIAAIGSMTTD